MKSGEEAVHFNGIFVESGKGNQISWCWPKGATQDVCGGGREKQVI